MEAEQVELIYLCLDINGLVESHFCQVCQLWAKANDALRRDANDGEQYGTTNDYAAIYNTHSN